LKDLLREEPELVATDEVLDHDFITSGLLIDRRTPAIRSSTAAEVAPHPTAVG